MVKIYGYELAQKIDLTLLKPEASRSDIIKLCKNAKKFGFIAVCVNPVWVPLTSTLLKNTGVKVLALLGAEADRMGASLGVNSFREHKGS